MMLFVQLLFIVASTKITLATPGGMFATPNSGYDNRTNRLWGIGKNLRNNYKDKHAHPSAWKEIVDGTNHQNSYDERKGSIIPKHLLKNRLGLFHFGKIKKSSLFDGNNKKESNKKTDNVEEHPLRTNLWEMNLNWSFLSRSPKVFSPASEWKMKRRTKSVKLELDPEGYCRIIEKPSINANKDKTSSNSPVLAIGRWKKRPWGVTIVVRPLFALRSSSDTTNLDVNGKRRDHGHKSHSKKIKKDDIIDEQTEFVFHANGFHWNGFGSNPKLTRGTILFQKQKKNNRCWWKSTTLAYSSILPVWPEELSGETGDDTVGVGGGDGLGTVYSDLLRFSRIFGVKNSNRNSISTQRRWFRPVVGTFTARGVI